MGRKLKEVLLRDVKEILRDEALFAIDEINEREISKKTEKFNAKIIKAIYTNTEKRLREL